MTVRLLAPAAALALVACRCPGPAGPEPRPAGGEARVGAPDDPRARMRRVENGLGPSSSDSIEERMRIHRVVGASVAVIHAAAIDWAAGYGLAEAGSGRRVDEDTLFQAASISKPVAAVAALVLVEQGELSLDEDVNARLSSWKVARGTHAPGERVTLRGLLGHRAGLTVHGFEGYERGARVPTLLEVLDGVEPANSGPVRVFVTPGSTWRYSGGGYCVLEQLLEDVTDAAFPDLARDLVLEPVGMTRSTFEQPLPAPLHHAASSGHHGDGLEVEGSWRVHPERAAAGLWTTPTDLALLVIDLLGALEGEKGGVVAPRTARALLSPRGSAGLGLMIAGSGPDAYAFHGGANVGFRCFLIAFPGRGQGAVIMTNSESGDRLIDEILHATASEYGWPVRPRAS